MTLILLNNSNTLTFIDNTQWYDQLSKTEISPDVVLLSSWEQSEPGFHKIQPLIKKLIDLGCKYFVCAGESSEALHDFIDDTILDVSFTDQHDNSNKIITTWHDTDTDDEVVDFFLHSTNVSNSLLAFFFNGNRVEDIRLKKIILSHAGSGL